MKWKWITQRTNENKSWFLEKWNKIDKHLAKLTKIKQKRHVWIQLVMKREIPTGASEIQGIIWTHFENLHPNTLENVQEMDQFLNAEEFQN